MERVLAIGDLHAPFTHPGYFDFCRAVKKEFRTTRTVLIGDEADHHAMSFHEHDPDGQSPGDENRRAKAELKRWAKAFPRALVCIGNHSKLPYRQAFTAGIPSHWLKSYNEAWEIAGWRWDVSHEIDGVCYTHGTGQSGPTGARNLALKKRQSVVIGHIHAHAGVQFHASERDLIFGMNVGCGIDVRAYAMAYGRDFPDKPVLGAGVVIKGRQPLFVPMDLGTKYPGNN